MTTNDAKEWLDVALHPVRMRILMLLSGSMGLTPGQIAEQMNDVPQATLYRHIKRLAQAGLLKVVEERPVRGTVEKVYALETSNDPLLSPGADAFNRLSTEDHLRYFTAFTMTLLDDFARYLNRPTEGPRDLAVDGVGYQKLLLHLSDAEFAAFAAALNQAIVPVLGNQPSPERKKRLLSIILMPAGDSGETPDHSEPAVIAKE